LEAKLAIAERNVENFDRAIKALREIDPNSPIATLYEGRSAIRRSDWGAAKAAANTLMTHPFHPTHLLFVRTLVVYGQFDPETYEELVATLRSQGEIAPDDIWYNRTSQADEDAVEHLDHTLFGAEIFEGEGRDIRGRS
jgi:hypothetical protein